MNDGRGLAGRLLAMVLVALAVGGQAAGVPFAAAQQECTATEQRPGLCNPLGPLPEQPILPDDEAVVFGFDGATQTIAVQDTLADEPRLRVLAEREAGEPLVARAGRVLGLLAEQVVVVQRQGSGMRLELLALGGCEEALPCPLVLGGYDFAPGNPDSELALDIGDLDGEPGEEIALAYETQQGGEARVQLVVLGFPGVQASPDPGTHTGPAEATVLADVTLEHVHENAGDSYDFGLLRSQDGGANHLRARIGHFGLNTPPAVLVAHVTPGGRLVTLPFALASLAGGDASPMVGGREAFELSAEAAAGGGWEVAFGPFRRSRPDRVLVVRRVSATELDVRQLRFANQPDAQCHVGDGDICDSGPQAGQPCTSNDECPTGPDLLEETGEPFSRTLCVAGTPCPPVSMLEGARLESSPTPYQHPFEWGEDQSLGLAVLVHTTRGPVVQTFEIVWSEPDRIEAVEPTRLTWPTANDYDARPEVDAPAPLAMFYANVIHHRTTANRHGTGTGDQFSPRHYLDRRPSLYMRFAEGEPWAVFGRLRRIRPSGSPNDAELETGDHCDGGSCELRIFDGDGPVAGFASAVLTAADLDGDSAYYRIRALGGQPENQHTLYLSAPRQLTIHDLQAPEVILQEPPKHVDYLRGTGGGRVHNVSQSPEFSVAYRNAVTDAVQVESEATTSVAFGEDTKNQVGAEVSGAVKIFTGELSASVTEQVQTEVETSTQDLALASSSTTLTQTFETSTDDQLYIVTRTVDIWRYPTIGLRVTGDGPAPKRPFFELVVPGAGSRSAESGRNSALYNPRHINGNVLSYPRFGASGDVSQAAQEDLRGFALGGECVDGSCVGGPAPGVMCSSAPQCAPEPLDMPIWAESSFDVSADTTTTLALSETSAESRRMSYSSAIAESTSYNVSGSLGVAVPMVFGASVNASHDYTVHSKHTFASSEVSTNSTSAENEISLAAPPLGAPEQTYGFAPAFYFDQTGAVKVTHHVSLPTGPASFWSENYTAPDPALHLPFRIVCEAQDCRLNQGSGRHAMKGLIIRHAAENPSDRHLVTSAPAAGARVRLEAQVWNLSVGQRTGELTVRFETVEIADDGRALGASTHLGDAQIDDLPPGDVQLASVEWDTTGFGDAEGGQPRTYRIRVVVDPQDAIEGETHEWLDRDDDPLLDEQGAALDPRTDPVTGDATHLEKGQNNEGWGTLTLAPSDATCEDRPDPCGPRAEGDGGVPDGAAEGGEAGAGSEDGGVMGDGGGMERAGADNEGCGCRVPGRPHGGSSGSLVLFALAALLVLRRARARC